MTTPKVTETAVTHDERHCDTCNTTGWLGHLTGDGQMAPDSEPCPDCQSSREHVPSGS